MNTINDVWAEVSAVLAPHVQTGFAIHASGPARQLWPVVDRLENALQKSGWQSLNPGHPHYPSYRKDDRYINIYIGWAGGFNDDEHYRLQVTFI
jgi:hypothetical protein